MCPAFSRSSTLEIGAASKRLQREESRASRSLSSDKLHSPSMLIRAQAGPLGAKVDGKPPALSPVSNRLRAKTTEADLMSRHVPLLRWTQCDPKMPSSDLRQRHSEGYGPFSLVRRLSRDKPSIRGSWARACFRSGIRWRAGRRLQISLSGVKLLPDSLRPSAAPLIRPDPDISPRSDGPCENGPAESPRSCPLRASPAQLSRINEIVVVRIIERGPALNFGHARKGFGTASDHSCRRIAILPVGRASGSERTDARSEVMKPECRRTIFTNS